ncbi:MAG: B12-binding domain-containing radical SAM protein [Spirochaetales bacterium]|nr:B12-binding domain-containing radical SAM protein [Spirochaetales bacterium]
MKITFIMPCVGKKAGGGYVKTWLMEPLAIAVLSSLTPGGIEKEFFDDRIEDIPYHTSPDLVAINVETYTAKRAYQIADRFRELGKKVIMGGFHATLVPDEVLMHADAVVTGAAEPVWEDVLGDFSAGKLKRMYQSGTNHFSPVLPDRSIYKDKNYTKIKLIETGRGCPFTCEFCSISSFFRRTYTPRPIDDVVREIDSLKPGMFFFIDDNIAVDKEHTKKLLKALIPLRINWVGQVSLDISGDTDLLELMHKSGCLGVLIGFESLNKENLKSMGKKVNAVIRDYDRALEQIRKYRLGVYATFLFGYDFDTIDSFSETLSFSLKHKFFFTAFNHVVPFPGTPLYTRLENENRLLFDRWWLSGSYRFGDIAFSPKNFTPGQLSSLCNHFRKRFYSIPSILTRGCDLKVNSRNLPIASAFFIYNIMSRDDVDRRKDLPLGVPG